MFSKKTLNHSIKRLLLILVNRNIDQREKLSEYVFRKNIFIYSLKKHRLKNYICKRTVSFVISAFSSL